MSTKKLYTVIIFSENTVGLLNQITIIFTRRQLNIETLSVSPSAIKGIHKFTITTYTDEEMIDKVVKQIDKRVDIMVLEGLFDEVGSLLNDGLSDECTAMQAIGYKEPAAYLRGEITKDEAIELIKRESRRYAKRQLTWLRRSKDIFWIRWGASPDFQEARRLSTEYLHSQGI